MICQQCGIRQATLHYTKIVNGEKTEYHLCEQCAKGNGESYSGGEQGFSIHQLLAGLMNNMDYFVKPDEKVAVNRQGLRCENCGLTFQQFSKIGRFGCSECYHYFSQRLDPLVKRIQGNTRHSGKVPERSGQNLKQKRELQQLKYLLQQAIGNEEFEKAAELRDQIKVLEQKFDAQ